ncbi:MAG: hypothetical protein J2P31_11275, partial [Blastocatellia bacterium]|nr:hypothetical protein [Blastocatellia bacterium]
QLAFENLRLSDDAVVPIRGKLTNAEDDDRNRFDDEGNIKSPASRKGALKITGAGAGAGIALGAVAGGAIAGAGVGAVAGLTVALLMKGRDVVIEPGHRFGLELIQPLSLNAETPAAPARTTIRTATVRNRPTSNSKANPKDKADSTANPLSTSASTSAHDDNTVAVDLSEVRSERTPDGVLLILLTAKTPGAGWRIMADHVVAGDQVEVELRGVPPATPASNRVSHPTAPTIRIPDHDAAIKRIVVRAKNGVREAKIGAYPGGSRPVLIRRTKPAAAPETEKPAGASGASTNSSATSSSSTTVSGPGIEAEIAKLRTDFGSEVGIQINQDGAYEPTGAHNLTPDEEQLLDALGSQLNAVRTYNRNSAKSAARRKNALLVEEDRKLTGQIWQRVKMNREMNQRFRAMLQNTQTLVANDLGEPLKSKAPASSPPQPAPNNSSIPAGPATAPPENSSTSSTLSGASLDDFAGTVIGEIELCQYDFGGVVGAWINPDGTYDLNGDRKLTADEKQMLDQLAAMLKSAKTLSGPAAKVDRGNVGKFRSETAKVGQSWKRVKMDAELNQKFSKMLQDARALADMASR